MIPFEDVMTIDWLVLAVAFAGVFTIGFMKGALGADLRLSEFRCSRLS